MQLWAWILLYVSFWRNKWRHTRRYPPSDFISTSCIQSMPIANIILTPTRHPFHSLYPFPLCHTTLWLKYIKFNKIIALWERDWISCDSKVFFTRNTHIFTWLNFLSRHTGVIFSLFLLPGLSRPFGPGESEDDHGRPRVVDHAEDEAATRSSSSAHCPSCHCDLTHLTMAVD